MKIAHLSVGDPFTAKWIRSQSQRGDEVHLIMLKPPTERINEAEQHLLPFRPPLGYYTNVLHLRRLLRRIKPDLLHVHYATGNATLGRLSGFHPSILSVWGSDVLIAPHESSVMHRRVVKNLRHFDSVCCTSTMLTQAVRDLCPQVSVSQIPIGVETEWFTPRDPKARQEGLLTIGTVKSLYPVYGIDLLLKAFAFAKRELAGSDPELAARLRLQIVGEGPQHAELIQLADRLDPSGAIIFQGYVPNRQIPSVLNQMDIFVALSRSESFGVAVVEASACGLPVVVTRIGGLPEVVRDGETGFIVEPENPGEAAAAIIRLAKNNSLREQLGAAGRRFVQQNYEWQNCLDLMMQLYQKTVALEKETQ